VRQPRFASIPKCVHGAIVRRDRIRDKDKDPSFSAKQTRAEEERVWAEIHERPFLAHWRHSGGLSE
jgi:hypothetical protein